MLNQAKLRGVIQLYGCVIPFLVFPSLKVQGTQRLCRCHTGICLCVSQFRQKTEVTDTINKTEKKKNSGDLSALFLPNQQLWTKDSQILVPSLLSQVAKGSRQGAQRSTAISEHFTGGGRGTWEATLLYPPQGPGGQGGPGLNEGTASQRVTGEAVK